MCRTVCVVDCSNCQVSPDIRLIRSPAINAINRQCLGYLGEHSLHAPLAVLAASPMPNTTHALSNHSITSATSLCRKAIAAMSQVLQLLQLTVITHMSAASGSHITPHQTVVQRPTGGVSQSHTASIQQLSRLPPQRQAARAVPAAAPPGSSAAAPQCAAPQRPAPSAAAVSRAGSSGSHLSG
jgi:hypothetical protein